MMRSHTQKPARRERRLYERDRDRPTEPVKPAPEPRFIEPFLGAVDEAFALIVSQRNTRAMLKTWSRMGMRYAPRGCQAAGKDSALDVEKIEKP